ncbi:thioredoxin family protein [Methylibium sp.]|uniref:thioredoxin family protein n=1 Tax=Methylibium sp. TaxID=2067992 RepID=UPI003D0E7F54
MTSEQTDDWLVACLCAQWCGTCRDYRTAFEALAREHPAWRFVWVDIEDDSDALAPLDLDIENFPTVLVARGAELRFFGTLLPHAATLVRTLEAARGAALVALPAAQSAALVATVRTVGRPVI